MVTKYAAVYSLSSSLLTRTIYFSCRNFYSNLTDSTTFFDLNLQAKKKEFLANEQLSSGEYSTIDLLQKVCTADGDDDDDDGNDDDGDDNDDD